MPYQGQIISIPEMLDTLVMHGRSDHEAARELESALEDRAIVLEYRNGHVFNGEDLAPVIELIRAFPRRLSSLLIGVTSQRLIDGGAGAKRAQFEQACGLGANAKQRLTAIEACRELILKLKQGPRLPKASVYGRAKSEIPDLIEKEFDRAWREVAGDWATGGRPKKPLN